MKRGGRGGKTWSTRTDGRYLVTAEQYVLMGELMLARGATNTEMVTDSVKTLSDWVRWDHNAEARCFIVIGRKQRFALFSPARRTAVVAMHGPNQNVRRYCASLASFMERSHRWKVELVGDSVHLDSTLSKWQSGRS